MNATLTAASDAPAEASAGPAPPYQALTVTPATNSRYGVNQSDGTASITSRKARLTATAKTYRSETGRESEADGP